MSLSLSSCLLSVIDQVMDYREELSNKSAGLIKYFPLFAPPFVTSYYELPRMDQIPKDLVCGAFIHILREMSTKFGYSIKRLDIKFDLGDFYGRMLNDSNEGMNIVLVPMSSSFFAEYQDYMISQYDFTSGNETDVAKQFLHSRALGFQSEGHILARKYPGQWKQFSFLSGFEPLVWYSLIATPILLSIIEILTERKSLRQISSNLWHFISVTIGGQTLRIQDSLLKNVSNILWLFCLTILLAAFSGILLPIFMEPIPPIVIDSWTDLYNNKQVKILAFQLSFMNRFVEEFEHKDEMARDFSHRYINYGDAGKDVIEEYTSKLTNEKVNKWTDHDYRIWVFRALFEKIEDLVQKMESGEYVFSAQMFQLETAMFIWDDLLCNKFHISRTGGGVSPYFLSVHPNQNAPHLEDDLNHLLIQLIESGIYDKWVSQQVYDSSGELREKIWHRDDNLRWEAIQFSKILDVFNLWLTGIAITIVDFLIGYVRLHCL